MRLQSLFALLFSAVLLSASARADSFQFTLKGSAGSADLSLYGNSSASNTYLITSATGTLFGQSATLLSTGTFGTGGNKNDNVVFTDVPYGHSGFFDTKGLSFKLADGSFVNLFSSGSGYFSSTSKNSTAVQASTVNWSMPAKPSQPGQPSSAVTPEPSSLLLLGTGVLAAGGTLRRRLLA